MLEKFFKEKFPKWAKILCLIFGAASSVVRAFMFVDDCIDNKEEKRVTPLVLAIIGIVLFPFGIVMMIFDLIDVAKDKDISWLCDLGAEKEAKVEEPAQETKASEKEAQPVEAEKVE